MIGYVTLGVSDLERAKGFYGTVLAPLGAEKYTRPCRTAGAARATPAAASTCATRASAAAAAAAPASSPPSPGAAASARPAAEAALSSAHRRLASYSDGHSIS